MDIIVTQMSGINKILSTKILLSFGVYWAKVLF